MNEVDSAIAQLRVDGQVALVTGASSGIGADVAKLLARRGAVVAVNYRLGTDRAAAVVKAIQAKGGSGAAFQADVTQVDQIKRMYDQVVQQLGPVDILVNNAGAFWEIKPFLEISDALWRESIDLNLMAAIFCSRAVLPNMIERRYGRIVNLSSVVTRTGGAGESEHYAVPKAGLELLTLGLAREFGQYGITVNSIAPGLVDTAIHDAHRERFDRLAALYGPLRRASTVREVAETVAFMAAPASSYVNGQVLHVSGGVV